MWGTKNSIWGRTCLRQFWSICTGMVFFSFLLECGIQDIYGGKSKKNLNKVIERQLEHEEFTAHKVGNKFFVLLLPVSNFFVKEIFSTFLFWVRDFTQRKLGKKKWRCCITTFANMTLGQFGFYSFFITFQFLLSYGESHHQSEKLKNV